MTRKRAQHEKPLISVVMPVYNAEHYIQSAIESILKQTYRQFELILVNDASTDSSLKIMRRYQKKHPRKITVINLKKNHNHGGDMCANEGMNIARGKYIARMDADDIALTHRLEKQVDYLEHHPEIFLVGSNAFVINKSGKVISLKREPTISSSIHRAFFTFNPLIHPTVMIRAEYANKQKFSYLINYSANNDFYTFFKLSCQGALFSNLNEPLLLLRIHDTNDTFVNIKEKFLNTLKVRLRMVKEYHYRPTFLQIILTIIQSAIVFLLPEKVTKFIYLVSKGIIRIALIPPSRQAKLGYN